MHPESLDDHNYELYNIADNLIQRLQLLKNTAVWLVSDAQRRDSL